MLSPRSHSGFFLPEDISTSNGTSFLIEAFPPLEACEDPPLPPHAHPHTHKVYTCPVLCPVGMIKTRPYLYSTPRCVYGWKNLKHSFYRFKILVLVNRVTPIFLHEFALSLKIHSDRHRPFAAKFGLQLVAGFSAQVHSQSKIQHQRFVGTWEPWTAAYTSITNASHSSTSSPPSTSAALQC